MNTSDIIRYDTLGFDGEKYIQIQSQAIKERIGKFSGKLYLEIWGKFLYDPHAARVLPWFFADTKKRIFSSMKDTADIIFCMNAQDIIKNRPLTNENISYVDSCIHMIDEIKHSLWIIPKVSINRISWTNKSSVEKTKQTLELLGYQVYFRYEIEHYPQNTKYILSTNWYGKDDYIPSAKKLVLVTWAASSSGKMSTCFSQIYLDSMKNIDSGYAKYETFPIWNLDLNHPINLAYEAATADIWDYNELDYYHKTAYGIDSVNYNRDIEAFELLKQLIMDFLPENNYTKHYKSPTDMWISNAWLCITNEAVVSDASIKEIERRSNWYQEMIDRWDGDPIWVERCKTIQRKIKTP